jgi:hypothetical protein
MALAMVPAGSSRPIEKIVPGPLCFDAPFGAPLPPAPGAAAPPPPPPSVRHCDLRSVIVTAWGTLRFQPI